MGKFPWTSPAKHSNIPNRQSTSWLRSFASFVHFLGDWLCWCLVGHGGMIHNSIFLESPHSIIPYLAFFCFFQGHCTTFYHFILARSSIMALFFFPRHARQIFTRFGHFRGGCHRLQDADRSLDVLMSPELPGLQLNIRPISACWSGLPILTPYFGIHIYSRYSKNGNRWLLYTFILFCMSIFLFS